MRARRAAVSLVEIVVAVAILATAVAAIMSLSTQETKAVAVNEEHLVATLALQELRECFGHRPRIFYGPTGKNFPATAEAFHAGYQDLLAEHRAIFSGGDPSDPHAAELAATESRLELKRLVLYEEFTTPGGVPAGRVTYEVRYTPRGGGTRRRVANYEIVY